MSYNKEIFEDKSFELAYQEIKARVIRNTVPVDTPVAVILGGLPGAGKGNIYDIYDKRLNGNLVKLDCDKFRKHYPYPKDLNEENYSYKTNDFVFAVVDRIIDEIAPLKYNFIVESSMRRPDVAFENANTLKPMGYNVELAVMGTNADIAWEGTISRYNSAKKLYEERLSAGETDLEIPRKVDETFFNSVKDNIEKSFEMIYEAKNADGQPQTPVDDIYIFNRSKEVLYHKAETPEINPVPILSTRLHYSETESIKKIGEYLTSSTPANIEKSGNMVLEDMANDKELYNRFLKFQGSIFKQNANVALEFFAQKPNVQFVATTEQWIRSGYRIKLGEEGICHIHKDGTVHEFFDFSQIDSDKPPVIWTIGQDNVSKVKSELGIPENSPVVTGLISRFITREMITDYAERLGIPDSVKDDFAADYLNSVQTIIAGRLEVGGNKFGLSSDNKVFKALTPTQRLHFLAVCAQSARNALNAVEKIINNNSEEERMRNNDLRNMDNTDRRTETEGTERGASGNTAGNASERPDISENSENTRKQADVGNSTDNIEREREDAVSGTEKANGQQSADVVQVQSADRSVQHESDKHGNITGGRTSGDLRPEMDGIHGGESRTSDGPAQNGEQIPDSSENSGRGSDEIQNPSGSAVPGGKSETEDIRGNGELGKSENDAYGRNSNEGESSDSENRINNNTENTETSVDSAGVSLRIEEINKQISEKEAQAQSHFINKEYAMAAQVAEELEQLNKELEILRSTASDSDDSELERAKQLITAFCVQEYDSEPDFSDLTSVGIAYTTYTDLELPVQVNADLENYRIVYLFNNKTAKVEQYASLEEMNSLALEHLDFDSFVALDTSEMIEGLFSMDETVDFTVITLNDSERIVVPGYVNDIDSVGEYIDLVPYGENIELSYEYCSIGDEGESDSATPEQVAFISEFYDYMDSSEHYQILESDSQTVENPMFEPTIEYDLEQHLKTNINVPEKYDYSSYYLLPDDEDNRFTAITSIKPEDGEWTDIKDLADILSIEDIEAIEAACVDNDGIPVLKDMPPETFTLLYRKSVPSNVEYKSAMAKYNERIEEALRTDEMLETGSPNIHREEQEKRYETVHEMLSDFENAYISYDRPVDAEWLKGKFLLSNKNGSDNILDTVWNMKLNNGSRLKPDDALAAMNADSDLKIIHICAEIVDTEDYNYHSHRGDSMPGNFTPEQFFALYEQTQNLISDEKSPDRYVLRDVSYSEGMIKSANNNVDEYISDKTLLPCIIDRLFARDEMEGFSYEYQKGADPVELAKKNISFGSEEITAPGPNTRESRHFPLGIRVKIAINESGDGVDIKHGDITAHYSWDEMAEVMKTAVDYYDAYEDAYEKSYDIKEPATPERLEIIENAFTEISEKYEVKSEDAVYPYINHIKILTATANLPSIDAAVLRGRDTVDKFGVPEYYNKLMDGKLFDFINDVNDIIGPKPDPDSLGAEIEVPEEPVITDVFEPVQTTMFDMSTPEPIPPRIVDGYNLTELLELDVMCGSGFEDGKFRINEYYRNSRPTNKEFADFLKKEYGVGGRSSVSPVRFQDHDSKGIQLSLENGKKYLFKWTEVAKMAANLIDRNAYITQTDIKRRINHAKWDIENRPDEPIILERAYRRLREHGVTEEGTKDTLISYADAYDMHSRGYEVEGYPENGLTPENREDYFWVTSLAFQAYQFEKTMALDVDYQNYTALSLAMDRLGLDINNSDDSDKARTIHEISSSVEKISNSFAGIPAELELDHELDLTRPETAKVVFDGINDAPGIYLYVEKELSEGRTDKIHEYLETVKNTHYLKNQILDRANAAFDVLKKYEDTLDKANKAEAPELSEEEMTQIIPDSDATYTIYQLKSSSEIPENHDVSFTSIEMIEKFGYKFPDISRYNDIYTDDISNIGGSSLSDKLENIFVKFNMDRPQDFKGHSLSVSDIIVVEVNSEKKAFYVDPVGFKDVTDRFYNPEKENELQNTDNKEFSESETVAESADLVVSIEKYGLSLDFNSIDSVVLEARAETYIGGLDSDGHERKDNYKLETFETSYYALDDIIFKHDSEYGTTPSSLQEAAEAITEYLDKSAEDSDYSVIVKEKDGSQTYLDANKLLEEHVKDLYPNDYAGVMEELSDLANDDDYTHYIGEYIEYDGSTYRVADFKNATFELEDFQSKEIRSLTVSELYDSGLGYHLLNENEKKALYTPVTSDDFITESADVFRIKMNGGVLVDVDIKVTEELMERLADYGLKPEANSVNRVVFNTDLGSWNKIYIPDKFGNKWNSIDAERVLNAEEFRTAIEVSETLSNAEQPLTLFDTPAEPVEVPELVKNETESYYDEDDHADDDLPEISYAANPSERFQNNMSAINELLYLEKYEQEHGDIVVNDYAKRDLRRYVGWGGLSEIFDETRQEYFYKREQLKHSLSEEEYNAAKSSTLNAHYTPQIVIDAMYKAIKNMELPRNARILEPACGTGNFISRLPAVFKDAEIVGVELDSVTSRIANMLNKDNENVTIINSPFEKSGLENNSFDLAIGNVPFGNYNMLDPDYSQDWKIHDAFFRKALDKVAPGGVVAFITSTGTLDKKNPKVREYLSEKSDLIGAIRLPNNTFSDAGTKTATDIIFLQKREEPRLKGDYPEWCYTAENDDGLRINSYFVQNPQMVLGKMEQTSHFNMLTCSPMPNANLEKQLDEAIRSLNAKITVKNREDAARKRQGMVEPWGNNFAYQIKDDKVYFRENNNMREVKMNKADREKLALLIDIRTAARELIDLQRTPITDNQLKPYREKLNELYDTYHEKYGNIAESKVTKVFGLDADLPIVLALEDYDKTTGEYSKAEIFEKRTVSPYLEISEVSTLEDALQVSMDRKGCINVEYMAELLKNTYTMENSQAVVADELITKGYAFVDPAEIVAGEPYSGITEKSEYLSGNVRHKLRIAEEYSETHPEFAGNVEALKQVIPEDIKAEEITVQMGCTWIDNEDYTKFLEELSGRKGYRNLRNCDVTYSAVSGEFSVNQARSKSGLNVAETTTYGTADFSLYNLAEKLLNQRRIVVKRDYTDPMDPSKTVNKTDIRATKLANEKARLIKEKFKEWIFADPERKEKYEQRYNNIFNSLVGRNYDGSSLTFPGMSSDFVLRPHQKDCVARTIYGGNTLAAHVVGAGKSAVIISSVMKKKDIGLINKACVVVPKPLTEQTANEWRKLYPDAKVLTVKNEDLATEDKRKIFTAKVATGSYDAVIVSQEQFEKLAMSKEYRAEYMQKQLDELEEHLRENKSDRHTVKEIETRKKKLQEKIDKIMNPSSASKAKDNLLEFEALGFDYLVVDEAHAYKNGFVMTKMNNVAGVTTRPSGRAEDMQMKTDYFNEHFGQGHILFATGTPVSNSMTELYVMTRYLRPDILKSQGVSRFDDWAATFGSVVTKNQQSADGRLKLKTKFASFANLPELMSMYKEFADIQSAEKLNLPRPKLKEDKIQIIKAEATNEQKAYVKELAKRAQAYEEGRVDSSVDNHLKITGEARLVGLGNMVVKALYERRGEEPPADFIVEKNSKIDLLIQNVADIYKKTNDTKGVQIIFSDIAVNSDNGNFSIYDYIKNELVNEHGIPESEIVFGPKSDAKNREQIFNDINNSKYRVVIASTDTLGTGANIQKNLYALHHADVPWKPSDFVQREGRILRQGNMNKEVEIFNYVTESTLDSYLYQTVTDKARFIAQLLDNNAPARVSEDCDEKVLSFAEIQAAAEGNADFKKRIELSNEIAELTMLKNEYEHETAVTRKNLELYPQSIERIENKIAENSIDLSAAKNISDNDFKVTTHTGTVLADTKEINSYLLGLVQNHIANPTSPSPVFSVGDFTVRVKVSAATSDGMTSLIGDNAIFEVNGKLSYVCEAGKDNTSENGKRLSNVFSKIIPAKAEELKMTLTVLHDDMKQAEERIAAPFQNEEKLQKMIEEFNELEERLISLSAGGDEFTDSDEAGVLDDKTSENAESNSDTETNSNNPDDENDGPVR